MSPRHEAGSYYPVVTLTTTESETYRKFPMFEHRTIHDRPRRDTRDLLSDEVVVDFPSTSGLVERIRASFFGSRDGDPFTHTTEVKLTPKEADEGIRVPLDLPVRLTCPVCGGRGEVWDEVCAVCTGTGGGLLSHHLNVRVPPGVPHGTRLRFCVSPSFAPDTHVEVRIAIP